MCGIVGVVAFDASLERARSVVTTMAERIHHRGPDGGGVVTHPDATLGMKRLAIVDVAHGHQPLANDDESIVLVYNGEIYNAPELRQSLERRGVRFRTRSDTEVILRLYEQDPDRVEEHLVGMWAFALHDRKRRRVVLSRDRFGIKPLFVADAGTGHALAFASELHCFDRALSPFARLFEVDADAAHAMVSWSYVPETATIWSGVRRLAPASRLEIDLATGARTSRRYWSLTPSPEAARVSSIDEACTEVERLLRRAVKEHLESDVPIATFLSGGIDSALVTALAAEESATKLKTYSIGFHEPRFDESPYARETARVLGLESEVQMLDEATAQAKLCDALLAYDEPFGDSSGLATYLLSEHVARDYKVALGGDGGDEVFAGYKKYLVVKLRRPFAAVPQLRDGFARALGRFVTGRFPIGAPEPPRGFGQLLRTARRLSRGLGGSDAEVYAQLSQIAPLARTEPLMVRPTQAAPFLDAARERFAASEGSELQRTLACELTQALCNDMLVKVDRASMAHHLEVRVPFLDHRVVEFGVGLPERYTLGMEGKVVLRRLHQRRFGSALAKRKKQGFGIPVQAWLSGRFDRASSRLFEQSRLDRYGILSSAALGGGRHREWVRTDPMVVWHAFALAAWCETTLGDGPRALEELLAEA